MNQFLWNMLGILYLIQLFFLYYWSIFWNLLKSQQNKKYVVVKEAEKKVSKLKRCRNIKLSEPLSSNTRQQVLLMLWKRKKAYLY